MLLTLYLSLSLFLIRSAHWFSALREVAPTTKIGNQTRKPNENRVLLQKQPSQWELHAMGTFFSILLLSVLCVCLPLRYQLSSGLCAIPPPSTHTQQCKCNV